MSIKDIFYKNAPSKVVTSASLDQLASKVESSDYVAEYSKDAEEYIPVVNFENPEEFAAFGSAEEYYAQSFSRIYQTYPYDGSRKEKTEWHLSSSYLDRYIFDKVYPTSVGVLEFGKPTWGSSQTSENDAQTQTAATATITVIDSSANPGVPFIGEGDTIALISTDGTTVTLTMQGTGGSTTSAGTSGATLTAKTLASGSYADSSLHATAQAVEIKTAINHHTKFSAANSANVVTITQADGGNAGNTTITKTELGATGMTNTDFTGGAGTFDSYNLSDSPQYITVNGGPNAASIHAHTASSDIKTNFKDERQKANVYHTGSYREANFMIDGTEGNTVEFWLKKASFGKSQASSSATPSSHCYFDLWNSSTDSGSNGTYGRLMIETRELSGSDDNYVEDKIFHVTYKSGSAGVEQLGIGDASVLSSSAFTDWHHYAFSFRNLSSEIEARLYIDGVLKETTTGGSNISKVTTDPLNAVIGAYKRGPTVTAENAGVTTGWGSISGSLDEFRYWKAARTSEQIGQNWFMPIGGGTNTDSANTKLGVYFKFNEGVTDNDTIDKKVLDYSGRISNGTINNYHTDMRHTGSAIISGSAATREQGDPIIYSSHPDVKAVQEILQDTGREYDYGNPSSIYKSIPGWITDEEGDKGASKVLTQILASYFDTLHMQIRELSNLRDIRYMSGSSDKPMPFANKLLSSTGMLVPEIFANADIVEQFLGANDERVFKEKLHNIKNFIYHNIYNNLTFINKSKGTEKSIRNMLRCFGVDDELYKLNIYANNSVFATDNNYRLTSTKKKFIDFDFGSRNEASVYQYKDPSNANAVHFLTASYNASTGFDSNLGTTFEAEIFLPKKPQPWETAYGDREYRTSGSSVFGAHTIDKESEYSVEETVDHGNFKVEVIRPDIENKNYEQHSDAFFKLSSYNNGVIPDLTSSIFLDAYDNSKWNLAVTVQPRKYIHTSYVSGTSGEQNDLQEDVAGYVVEFRGVNAVGDHIKDEFNVTQSITDEQGKQFITSPKRMFCGAHRTNFTGSVISKSDVRISSVRNWTIPLSHNDLRSHARDTKNYGVERPFQSAYLNQASGTTVAIPKIETLALHWDFETVTGSDDSGEFYVEDASSGSLDYNRYGTDFGKLLESQHTGLGIGFNANSDSVFINEYVLAAKQQLPESLRTDNMVEVLEKDDEFLTRDKMPVNYFAALEKSMYQTISEEMINMFAGATQLNSFVDLFSRPVDKYRQSYKRMRKARNVFFDKVNNVPDLERYLNYYKWLDDAISTMVAQLIPASMDTIEVRNIVESHILERNKYWHKFPTLEMKFDDPEGAASGIGELYYNWRSGHAPLFNAGVTAATATITVIDSSAVPGVPYIGEGDTIALISTDDTTVTLTMQGTGGSTTSAEASGATLTAKTLASGSYADSSLHATAQAVEIRTAINHHTKFSATNSANVVTITQATTGEAGNTTITITEIGATGLSKTNFTGGTSMQPRTDNCLWWKERAERSRAPLDTGDSSLDNSRALIHTASVQIFNRRLNSPYRFTMDPVVVPSINKSAVFKVNTGFGSSDYISIRPEDIEERRVCLDEKTTSDQRGLTTKQKLGVFGKIFSQVDNASTQYYKNIAPFSIYSASVPAMSQSTDSADAILSNKTGRDSVLLTNLHNDTYHENFDAVLQSPFTETHVGGSQHRHIGLNPSVTQDTAKTRPEAWKIDFQTDGELRIYSPYGSPDSEDSAHEMPRARYSRDELTKRPINIRNIANENLPSGSMMRWGNYDKNYQVVQIAGRAQDSYLVDNINAREYEGKIGKKSESTAVSGNLDFELPTRERNESYIIERFSAPGDQSTISRGFLDVETETYSVYNALPYRNLSVRIPLQTWLTASCGAFGLYAGTSHEDRIASVNDGTTTQGNLRANYHKINRNGATRKRLKEGFSSTEGGSSNFEEVTVKDNYYIQHPIPQSSMQYSWITASATSGPFGHEQPDASYASLASTDITFLSASEHGTFSGSHLVGDSGRQWGEESEISGTLTPNANFAFTDFAGINFHVYEPVTGSLRKLGYPAGTGLITSDNADIDNQYANRVTVPYIAGPDDEVTTVEKAGPRVFNALMLHRNGPYGYPTWKQIRAGEHPVARHFKASNTMLHTKMVSNLFSAMDADVKITKKEKTFEVIEPAVSSKHHPMVHNFLLNQEKDHSIQLVHSYANNLTRFSNQNFNNFLGLENTETQMYDSLKKEYIDGELSVPLPGHGNDPFNEQPWEHTGRAFKDINFLTYKETVYPADYNTYLGKTRGRENYSETTAEIDTKTYSTQRTFWRGKLEDRLRTRGTASNSQGKIIEYLHGVEDDLHFLRTGSSEYLMDNTSPDGNTSLDLSIWPLDADGPANDLIVIDGGSNFFNGNVSASNGELTTFKMYTIFHAQMQPTASLQFDHIQHIPYSGTAGLEYNSSASFFSIDNATTQGNALSDSQAAYIIQLKTQIPKWRTNKLAGKDPWYDSYDDYAADIRLMAKDYSVLPEFKISDHMEFYLENGFFNKTPKDFLIVPGGETNTSASSDSAEGSVDNQFYKIYSHSDFLKHFEVIREDQKNITNFNQKKNYPGKPVEKITLSCNAIMKLLPYNGFYPVLRTVQLGQMLSQSFGPYIGPDSILAYSASGDDAPEGPPGPWREDKEVDQIRLQSFLQPFFAPGIMYNTIKSGIAVDWPTFTGAPAAGIPAANADIQSLGGWVGFISGGAAGSGPNYRMPFESLIEPQRHLPISSSDGTGAMFLVHPGVNIDQIPVNSFTDLPVYFDWKGNYHPKYSLAMHNFTAEIPEFFLKEKNFSRFISKKQSNGFNFASGTTYYMDVVLNRTEDMVMYEGPARLQSYRRDTSEPHTDVSIPVSSRGTFYGPPSQVFGGEEATEFEDHEHGDFIRNHYDPAFAPYTPPYFYGTSVATLQFKPHEQRDMSPKTVEEFSLDEIFQNVKFNLINETSGAYNLAEYSPVETIDSEVYNLLLLSNAENEIAGKDCMQISASVELFGKTQLKKLSYEVSQSPLGLVANSVLSADDPPGSDYDAWVIGSKFECPVLNFTGTGGPAKGTLPADMTDDQQSIFPSPLGMWKGYGEFPDTNEGIFLKLKESSQFTTATEGEKVETIGSLLQVCGFKADIKKRIGDIADQKKISEAVIAIPMDDNGNFFPIDKATFENQLKDCNENLDTGTTLPDGEKHETSVTMMIDKMRRFYIPPHLDFLRNSNVDPFVMYIFEFEHLLDKQDLADIWQGVMPKIATRAKQSKATITHHVNTPFEFFGNWGNGFPLDQTNMRWMVFKVKQRAKNNYFGKSPKRESGEGFSFQIAGVQGETLESELDFSYNWPYDFFSLVELASVDTEFRIGPGVKAGVATDEYYGTLYAEPSLEEQIDSADPE